MQSFFALPEYPCRADMWDVLRCEKRPIVVYGMGNGADKLLDRLGKYEIEISDFFASDGFVRGHYFHGKRVKSFSEICSEYEDFVILLSFASKRKDVLDMLCDLDGKYDMLIPDMPVANTEEYFDKDFYNSHYGEIVKAYAALADDVSRNTYASLLNYKLTGKMDPLLAMCLEVDEIYGLIDRNNINTAIDAGAYNGDTAREMKQYFCNLQTVYAIEPDPRNFKKLCIYSEAEKELSVVPIKAATWNESGISHFSVSGNRNSTISATASYEHEASTVPLITVDGIADQVDYIKYDVEGAEKEALMGSIGTISRDNPTLLISVYHRSRDIFDIVNYMREKHPGYSLYMRRTRCTPAWEIALICVPENQC